MGFYVVCDDDSRHESMTKEQILAAITQAIENGSIGDIDTGFVTRLKEQNSGCAVTIWVGTRAQYNVIVEKARNCLYIITDDTTGDDIVKACEQAMETATKAQQFAGHIDFTNEVTLSWVASAGGVNLTVCNIVIDKYIYSPALGIVFYKIGFEYAGTMAANETVEFRQIGGYKPTAGVRSFPAMCSGGTLNADKFDVSYTANGDIAITSRGGCNQAEVLPGIGAGISITGWYFSDGTKEEV